MLNQRFAGSVARSDVLFLTSVVALSVGLYVHRLGFYYDDWSILGYLHTAPDQSFFGLIRTAYTFLPNDQNRHEALELLEPILHHDQRGVLGRSPRITSPLLADHHESLPVS